MILRIIMNVNVGELTDIKLKKIQEILNKDFPSGVSSNFQLIATGNKEQFIITPNTIEYINNEGDIGRFSKLTKSLFDLLMIDNNIEKNTLLLTDIKDKEMYSFDYIENQYCKEKVIEDSIGLGIRNFFIWDKLLCEFRIEPYISDPKKIYIEGIYNVSNVSLGEFESVIKSIKEDYTKKKDKLNI